MSAIPYRTQEVGWDGFEDDETLAPSRRRRRQWWGRGTALLLAAVVGAACFYAGVRVEKGQLASSSSPLAAATSGATGTRAGASGRSGLAALFAGAAGRGGLAGAFGGGSGTFGTVTSVDGKNLYVTETSSGDVVKVTLSSATAVTKSVGVSKSAIRPGDSVTVEGVKSSNGTVAATSVSDSGSRSSAAGTSSSSSSSSSSSAVNSLFGGG